MTNESEAAKLLQSAGFEKWLWIELIGFDNELPDFGVAQFLERVGFQPDGISILLFSPEFIHSHSGMDTEQELPLECCSYAGRPTGRERMRQQWTNYQLQRLIQQLKLYEIEVYCSFFNLFDYLSDGQLKTGEWCGKHRYLCELRKNGEYYPSLNPLRRLADGTYYEDLFVEQLKRTIVDYGFDGYHGADGYTSARLSLAEADYSDDMVDQFRNSLPTEERLRIEPVCEGDPERLCQRADWIWTHMKERWIAFYADRWVQLWEKIVAAMHVEGRKVLFNTAWTRDPFEALYRYGIDYRRIAQTGIDAFVVETVTGSLTIGAAGVEMEPHYEFQAMLLTIKAYVPQTRLICLNAIHDTTESWDVLRHAPTILERDIYSLSNQFIADEAGQLVRCASGLVACLSDGLERHEWQWIGQRWNLGFGAKPTRLNGAYLVWSDHAFEHQLVEYIVNGGWTPHKFVYELTSRGAPIFAAVRIEHLHRIDGPIVVPNPHLLAEEELAAVMNYDRGATFLIGSGTGIYSDSSDAAQDPVYWTQSLPVREIPESYLQSLANRIRENSRLPAVVEGAGTIKLIAYETDPGCCRLYIYNENDSYESAMIEMNGTIRKISIGSKFPVMPIIPDDRRLRAKVPGRGMIVLDILF